MMFVLTIRWFLGGMIVHDSTNRRRDRWCKNIGEEAGHSPGCRTGMLFVNTVLLDLPSIVLHHLFFVSSRHERLRRLIQMVFCDAFLPDNILVHDFLLSLPFQSPFLQCLHVPRLYWNISTPAHFETSTKHIPGETTQRLTLS